MGRAPYTAEYSLPAWLELLRPHNGLLAMVAVVAGAYVAAGTEGVSGHLLGVFIASLIVFLFIGGGNALNDYYDYETDKVNHPNRPLPSGRLAPEQALWIGRGLLLGVVGLSLVTLNPLAGLLVAVAAAAMVAYEVHLKERGLVGNLTIAGLSGALFLFGGVALLNVEGGGGARATLVLGFLAALATLGREIIKDVEDAQGDGDRTTLAHTLGEPRALALATGLLVAAVLASPLPYMAGLFEGLGETLYLGLVVAADLLFLVAAQRAHETPRTGQQLVKAAMLVALLAFLAGAAGS